MKIRLLNYEGKKHYVEIPDDTEQIVVSVISGDMILESPKYYDTGNFRTMDFYDGSVTIKKDKFNEFNNVEDSYGIFEINK